MVSAAFTQLLRRRGEIITPRGYSRLVLVRGATLAVVLLACCGAQTASAQANKPADPNPLLWATVNVCDTAQHPDTIGIRASMPGTAKGRETMFMRFQAQYLSGADDRWHNVAGEGDSGFLEIGGADVKARQKGRYIKIDPKSERVMLRGLVTFEWRLQGKVVRRAQRRTRKGHRSRAGADPPNYSAASCTVKR
jgi:hypothetical protein